MNFITFKTAVAAQFERLSKHQIFRVNVSKDDLWSTYLASFPEGTNPLFRERTEHDCTCCKQFIRAVGDCVAVIDGQLESIWDVLLPSEPGYQAVAAALSGLVHSASIQEHIIDVKLAERAAAAEVADRAAKKQKLMELIASKKDEALSSKSLDELQAELASL